MASRSNKQVRYNTYDRTDKNANRIGPRRQVGEADPVTRRKFLDQQLAPAPRPSSAPKSKPAAQEQKVGRLKERDNYLHKIS